MFLLHPLGGAFAPSAKTRQNEGLRYFPVALQGVLASGLFSLVGVSWGPRVSLHSVQVKLALQWRYSNLSVSSDIKKIIN